MWILDFLPDSIILFFCNSLLLIGLVLTIAGFFAHRIPMIWRYQLPFRVIGVALLVLGVYFRGGVAVEQQWRERVSAVEARLAEAEQQSRTANTVLNTKAQEKIKYIQGRNQVVTQYIDREVVRYDTKFAPGGVCEIPQEFVKAHNSAAEGIVK